MIRSAHPTLARFLASLHRRAVVVHCAERAGLGLLAGSCLGLVFTAIRWRQSDATIGPAVAAMVGGSLVGLLWGIARRPSRLAAALEADRQLRLDDLLGTAAALSAASGRNADGWHRTVLNLATSACAARSPSNVILHRLGVRAWGGIGIAATLTLVASLLAAASGPTFGERRESARPTVADSRGAPVHRPLVTLAADGRLRTGPHAGPEEATTPGGGQDRPADQSASRPSAGAQAAANADAVNNAAGGIGEGSARSAAPANPSVTPVTPTGSNAATPATSPTAQAVGGGGGTTADASVDAAPGASGRTAGESTSPPAAAPWQSTGWQRDVDAARSQLDRGQIPPAYRDLVRAYFE